jgi:hypothetical protein
MPRHPLWAGGTDRALSADAGADEQDVATRAVDNSQTLFVEVEKQVNLVRLRRRGCGNLLESDHVRLCQGLAFL